MKTETLIKFLAEAFEEIGGVTNELEIDNLKQFVESPRFKNNEAILTNSFDKFLKDHKIKANPSLPARPQTKGKTETQNKVVDQLKNYNGKYNDLIDIHEMLETINKADNEKVTLSHSQQKRLDISITLHLMKYAYLMNR